MLNKDEIGKLVEAWKQAKDDLLVLVTEPLEHYSQAAYRRTLIAEYVALLDALSRALQVDLAYQNAALGSAPYR